MSQFFVGLITGDQRTVHVLLHLDLLCSHTYVVTDNKADSVFGAGCCRSLGMMGNIWSELVFTMKVILVKQM